MHVFAWSTVTIVWCAPAHLLRHQLSGPLEVLQCILRLGRNEFHRPLDLSRNDPPCLVVALSFDRCQHNEGNDSETIATCTGHYGMLPELPQPSYCAQTDSSSCCSLTTSKKSLKHPPMHSNLCPTQLNLWQLHGSLNVSSNISPRILKLCWSRAQPSPWSQCPLLGVLRLRTYGQIRALLLVARSYYK